MASEQTFKDNEWALILGGSSGFGLATAKKLAEHGMNLCIVHRDRKGAMAKIEPEFEALKQTGVKLLTFNTNALDPEKIEEVALALKSQLGEGGVVRMLMHSIAFGNLKLLAAEDNGVQTRHQNLIKRFSEELGLEQDKVQEVADRLFDEGEAALLGVASPATYNNEQFLQDEDFQLTVYSMGTSLVTWVQTIFKHGIFAKDARILSMTSEGNEIAWKGYAAVSAAKVALEAVSRALALEYAPYGIRSNVIQAGVTDTPALRLIPGSMHLKASAKMRNPFKRITRPEDVAQFIYLMCREEAAWVNGNVIRVDGGEHIGG